MMIEFRLTDESQRLLNRFKHLHDDMYRAVRQAMYFTGKNMREEAQFIQKKTPKTGRVYYLRKGASKKFRHVASAAGEAPAVRTGSLYRSTGFEVKGVDQLILGAGGQRANVTITKGDKPVQYAKYLESGTRKMKPRPFIEKTGRKNLGLLEKHITTEIKRIFK